jgi:hypothetical protein
MPVRGNPRFGVTGPTSRISTVYNVDVMEKSFAANGLLLQEEMVSGRKTCKGWAD